MTDAKDRTKHQPLGMIGRCAVLTAVCSLAVGMTGVAGAKEPARVSISQNQAAGVSGPALLYSTYFGGSGFDSVTAIAVGPGGYIFIVGWTDSDNLPTTNALQASRRGSTDAFVAKFSPDGRQLIFSTYLGGSGDDRAYAVKVDTQGNPVIAGRTASADFPSVGGPQPYKRGGSDAFVTKLSASGSAVLMSTFLGGSSQDTAHAVTLDDTGNIYVAGETYSRDFPVLAAYQSWNGGGRDAFVTKIMSGGWIGYSTYVGGVADDIANAIAVDALNHAYVAGETASMNFPTQNPLQQSLASSHDGFVTKLGVGGSNLVYSTYLGGPGSSGSPERAVAIAVDSAGQAYVYGTTNSLAFPLKNAFQPLYGGSEADTFIAKLNAAGSALLFSSYVGAGGGDFASAIALGPEGDVWVAGFTWSWNFPTTQAIQPVAGGSYDVFVARLKAASGLMVDFGTYLGGSAADAANAIALDSAGRVHIAGTTQSINWPTKDPLRPWNYGVVEGFVAGIGGDGVRVNKPDTVGAYNVPSSNVYLKFTNEPGSADIVYQFGNAGDIMLTGDWDGDGIDTAATFRDGVFTLKNSNSQGPADLVISLGNAGDKPVAGDWDGDGVDTVGVYDPATATWTLQNGTNPGPNDLIFNYGPAGSDWVPLAGDWDGNGDDTPGLYDPGTGTWFLRNSDGPGLADLVFVYGPGSAGWRPMVGDWDGDGDVTPGLYSPASGYWYLHNSLGAGPADLTFQYGPGGAGWTPLAGSWR